MTTLDRPIAIHLVVRDPAAAAQWYADVFGALETLRVPLPDGTPLIVQLAIGATTVALAGEGPGLTSPSTLGGNVGAYIVEATDTDALWERAIAAGATEFHPLADAPWGERTGQFIDPFGHRWGVTQKQREASPEEVVEAIRTAYGIA
jgi:PhnB protein